MQIVGLVISWAVAIGIIGIGIGYAAKSEMNATRFGLPQLPEREARGWWQGQGSPRHRFWSSGNRRHYRCTR